MTKYEFPITIPASGGANRVNVAVAAFAAGAVPAGCSNLFTTKYLPAVKLSFQMAKGNSGQGFVGGTSVDQTGTGADYTILSNATTTLAGQLVTIESQIDVNDVNIEQFNIHGTVPGDVVLVSYFQA